MLSLLALGCPQCSAPLPRAARWRTVNCSYCGATITRGEETVERESFRAALRRANADSGTGRTLQWRGARYRVLAPLAIGEHSEVLLAERLGALPERVTVKLAREPADGGALLREGAVLQALQELSMPGAAYFTRRLPLPVGTGLAKGLADGDGRQALVLRHPPGFWGSLHNVQHANPHGIDPRHAVWLWRRMLEVLAFVHDAGWTHRDLSPAHALVHPRDHGVLIVGWSRAQQASGPAHAAAAARDLMQSAWTIRAVLHGVAPGRDPDESPGFGARTPAPLAALLRQCSEDAGECRRLGARGIEQALSAASREAFGAPQFVHFDPAPRA